MLFFVININICEDLTEKRRAEFYDICFDNFFSAGEGLGTGWSLLLIRRKDSLIRYMERFESLHKHMTQIELWKDGAFATGELLPSKKSSKCIIFIFSIKNNFSMQLAIFLKLFLFQSSRKKLKKLFHSNPIFGGVWKIHQNHN